MISNTALRVVENNSFTSKDFTIQASGKMFHMVISGLYSNKPQSITRELWSNAFDAHVMAGKQDVPFEVTYPTAITPTLSCRDFGDGIAHEDMEGFYTVLGHSSKENTNKAVGKWGVGRMSPMSYTDTFSVVSRHKGMIAYYSIQLGPDGSPQLHVLAPPTPTDEPSGLEIFFPVKRQDIPEFQKAYEVVSFGFDVPPRVTNSQEKTFTPINKQFEGEGYYLYEDDRLTHRAYAQMGCVLYPIPHELAFGCGFHNIVYKFDIGDLEVTASREGLSFGPNDPTSASIKAKMEKVKLLHDKQVQKQLDCLPTLFQATKELAKLNYFNRTSDFKWRGADIPSRCVWPMKEYYDKLAICVSFKSYGHKTVSHGFHEPDLQLGNDFIIFVQDVSKRKENARASRRIAISLDTLGKTRYVWIKVDPKSPESKAALDKLLKEVEYPFYHVSDLPDEGAIKKGPRGKISLNILEGGDLKPWDMDDATFNAGGLYTVTNNREYPRLIRLAEDFIKGFMGVPHIVMVPKSLSKKFEAADNWQVLEPELEKSLRSVAEEVRKALNNRYDNFEYHLFKEYAGKFGGKAGEFASKVKNYVLPAPHKLGLHTWRDIFGILKLPMPSDDEVRAEYHYVLRKYPLLGMLNNSKYTEEFVRYVKLVDENDSNPNKNTQE
jgi:hypothetical protein